MGILSNEVPTKPKKWVKKECLPLDLKNLLYPPDKKKEKEEDDDKKEIN